ncbi:YhgE/Pip domain-containing protein [Brevibacterium sp. BRM-1]|uniref:YhgE/Pip domain-containing protein n=1 Tax=Brevibacterium sp. BRM-1 TaxID=2999062 RepID=UPI00228134BC|nr:YhgE/Pip domain-containing protein [Brevibacterium sp. BRM-1]WAL39304.1 YhgE/Pip domain-containing protein [Brevibacterium sp. BRM-1]
MFSLPFLELSRFKRSTLTRLAIIVVLIIPTIYGGTYLASNWDPPGNLDKLDAAIVNLDRGAEQPSATGGKSEGHVNAGDELVENMTGEDGAGFTWKSTSASEAQQGLDSGKYAAILTVPSDFSAHLVSTGGDDPEQAQLNMQTNDANNYIVGKAASQILNVIRENLNKTTTGKYVNQVYIGFNNIFDNISKAADSAGELHDGAAQLHTGSVKLADGADQLADGTGELVDGTGQAVTGSRQLHSGLVKLDAGAGDLADATGQARSGSKTLASGASQVADGTAQLQDKADDATKKADDFHRRADDLVNATAPKIDRAAKDFDTARNTVRGDIGDDVERLAKKYPDDPDIQRLVKRADAVGDDLDAAHQRAVDAFEDGKQLRKDAQSSADRLIKQVDRADRQIGKLNDGAQQVAAGAGTLHTGLVKLDKGANTLHDSTGQAASGAKRLADGAVKLNDGAVKLDKGANTLADSSHQLADGAKKIDDGSGQLAAGLDDGAKQIPTYSKSDRENRSEVVALPVTGENEPQNAVNYYGEGLAPFFISLALWIGGMITYMVIKAIPFRALASTASSWRVAWSGYVPALIFAVGQVLILWATLAFILDFTVSSWLWTLLFSIIVAASFHTIHQMCVVLFGAVGRLLALVLLMVQLGAAGGTYPVQTAPAFFQAISPYLPMTWAVSGLRALIAGGEPIHAVRAALVLILFGLCGLLVSTIACSAKRVVRIKDLHPSLEL